MLALFLAIALLGTDSAYGPSTIDLTGVNHDNTDLGDSELYAKITGNYGSDYRGDWLDGIDFTGATVDTVDLIGSTVTADSIIGLGPSGPSPSATPASPVPPSPSIDGGLGHLADAPDGGFSSSIIDISGANHDNADLGGSELHLMTEAEMATNYGDMPDNFDLAADTVDTVDVVTPWSMGITGLGPSGPLPSAPSASPVPPSPSPLPAPTVTDWHTTDWWVYDPVDGEITGPNPDNPDVLANARAGYSSGIPIDSRTTDEKLAKARMVRDDPRGAKLSADGGFSDDPVGPGDLTDARDGYNPDNNSDDEIKFIVGLESSRPSPPATPASPVPPSPSIDGVAVLAPKLDYLNMVALADIDWTGVVLTDQSGEMLTGEKITTTGDMLGYKTGDMLGRLGPEFAKKLGIQLFADQPPPPPSPSPPPTSPHPPTPGFILGRFGICCAIGAFVVFVVELLLAGAARVMVRRTPVIKMGAIVYNYPLITVSQCATMTCDGLMV